MPAPRRTIAAPATVTGRALFTAADSSLTIHPADAGQGIVFERSAECAPATIGSLSADPIHPAFAKLPPRCTCLRTPSGAPIATVEHILSALVGLGITDATIQLEAPEAPIHDGSARAFVEAILSVGVRAFDQAIEPAAPTRELRVESGDASITITPAERAEYVYDLDFGPGAPITPATATWSDGDDYVAQVAPARTFCLQHEAEAMTALGLFAHLSPEDMLVIGPDGPIDNHYRFPDEPARHKLLDLIGDLALVGRPLRARVHAVRAGHALNHAAARAIVESLAD